MVLAFLAGLFVGVIIGGLIIALCVATKHSDIQLIDEGERNDDE